MNVSIIKPVLCVSICACVCLLASPGARAQRDTVEFKLIPKYYPDENMGSGTMTELDTSAVIFKPSIDFPGDPGLQGQQAKVTVKVLVDTQGLVRNARVIKSTNKAFNEYALKYAMQYRFNLPAEISKGKEVWVAMPINFKQH